MRKRSAYKPRPRIANPMGYVMESVSFVSGQTTFIRDLHIRNHLAMTALTQGKATKGDMDLLIAMNNVVEALWRLGYGKGYEDVLKHGSAALLAVAMRGAAAEREACARVCETEGIGAKYQGDVYAVAIRARGEK